MDESLLFFVKFREDENHVQELALSQLWLFWVAPILGATIAGFVYPLIAGSDRD